MKNHVRLVHKDNVLAILSNIELNIASSAFYNGGFRRTRTIVNAEVPDTYGNQRLHEDPISFVQAAGKRLGVPQDFVGMVTAAKIKNFSLVKERRGDLAVCTIATAGCSHSESAGEPIEVQEIEGTINVIVLVDADPTESCLIATLANAVEAKAAAMRDLDIRSRYSGDSATGTITDSIAVAATNRGPRIVLGGPPSELGQLVGKSVRQAVTEAIANQGECLPRRSLLDRLAERHLQLTKLTSELSKIKALNVGNIGLDSRIKGILNDPFFASVVLAAMKLDDDIEKGLIPSELSEINRLASFLGGLLSKEPLEGDELEKVDLPPFLRGVLVAMLGSKAHVATSESLK